MLKYKIDTHELLLKKIIACMAYLATKYHRYKHMTPSGSVCWYKTSNRRGNFIISRIVGKLSRVRMFTSQLFCAIIGIMDSQRIMCSPLTIHSFLGAFHISKIKYKSDDTKYDLYITYNKVTT